MKRVVAYYDKHGSVNERTASYLVKAVPKPLMPISGGYDSHQCKKCNITYKFLICSMLSCNGCSTGYKIYNQNIRLATLFFISLLPKVCPETE